MLEEDDVILWVEKRLDSISNVDDSICNVLCGIRKKLWTTVFCIPETHWVRDSNNLYDQKQGKHGNKS